MKTITINKRVAVIYKMDYMSWSGYYQDECPYRRYIHESGQTYWGYSKADLLSEMGYIPKPRKPYAPRKRIESTDLYRKVNSKSKEIGETNDCSVITLSITTGESYEDAHAALELAGRKRGDGARWCEINRAIDILGFKLTKVQKPNEVKTIKRAEEYFKERGSYILDTASHVAAMIDGVVHDWSRGRALRVKNIYKIEKIS